MFVCRWTEKWRTDLHNSNGTKQLMTLALLIYCGDKLFSWMLFMKKGYLLVCTSIKLTVHHIYFISASPVIYKEVTSPLNWHFHPFVDEIIVYIAFFYNNKRWMPLKTKQNKNPAQTHENTFLCSVADQRKWKTLPLLFAKLITQGGDTWHGSLGGLRWHRYDLTVGFH